MSEISHEFSENRFEKSLNQNLKLKNSSKLKLKYFFPNQTLTILDILKSTYSSLEKNFRVDFNSAIEMCTTILTGDSMNYEINPKVHAIFVENKCKLIDLLSVILNKSGASRYSVYGFMSNIHSQFVFKQTEKSYILKVYEFLLINIKKFPTKFYYDILFETINVLEHLPTIVLSSRMSTEEKEISTVKINTKKVTQISLFSASTVGLFDTFWVNADKLYKDKFVVKVLELLDKIFDEILIDFSFSNNLLSKIISTFTVFFLSNIKQFLTLNDKEKSLIIKIICKSGKICYKDGLKKDKCYDLDYIRKVNSFINSLVDIDVCDSNNLINNYKNDFLNYLQEKEQKYYLLDKRVLESEFYESLEKEFEVIKKKKLDELTKSYEEKIVADQQQELLQTGTVSIIPQNDLQSTDIVNRKGSYFLEEQNDQNDLADSWVNTGFNFNKAEDQENNDFGGLKSETTKKTQINSEKMTEKNETNFLDFLQKKDQSNGHSNPTENVENTKNDEENDFDYDDIENMPSLI